MSVQLELDASNELFTQTTEVGPDQTCLEMTRRPVPDGFYLPLAGANADYQSLQFGVMRSRNPRTAGLLANLGYSYQAQSFPDGSGSISATYPITPNPEIFEVFPGGDFNSEQFLEKLSYGKVLIADQEPYRTHDMTFHAPMWEIVWQSNIFMDAIYAQARRLHSASLSHPMPDFSNPAAHDDRDIEERHASLSAKNAMQVAMGTFDYHVSLGGGLHTDSGDMQKHANASTVQELLSEPDSIWGRTATRLAPFMTKGRLAAITKELNLILIGQ